MDGYPVEGSHYIAAWGRCGPTIVIVRSTMRGRPWLRCVRRLEPRERELWWVSGYKTRALALAGRL